MPCTLPSAHLENALNQFLPQMLNLERNPGLALSKELSRLVSLTRLELRDCRIQLLSLPALPALQACMGTRVLAACYIFGL